MRRPAHEPDRQRRRPVAGRRLTDSERDFYAPYIRASALDVAVVFDGKVPLWLRPDMDAITLGNRIYLRPGVYAPDTAYGVEILGHELAHVVQYQNGMTYARYLWESRRGYRDNRYEVEAYAIGARMRADFLRRLTAAAPREAAEVVVRRGGKE
ncbi:MAG TPA: DUF4157 domain-containing protein [Burkholderiaceae bacterium]|nr:DUF4157 domain-containing protein [Burkholderiaceae bacterium]